MIRKSSSLASAAAVVAAFSMAATPAAAADMPAIAAPAEEFLQVNTGDAGEANQYRRYRRHGHYRHRDRGIDAGDVIAGVVVLGALAAIIGSSNNRDRDRRDERRERIRYDDRPDSRHDSGGIESAVDMCVDQVEYRDNRVENVDRADRSANGWNVSGTLSDGERWTCFIDNGGEIRSIDYGTGAYPQTDATPVGTQMSDIAYRNARATTHTAADQAYTYDEMPAHAASTPAATTPADDGLRPAYPGGPLPGENGYDIDRQQDATTEESEWDGDGRYTTAQAPNFQQPTR